MRKENRIDNKKTAVLFKDALRASGVSQADISKNIAINQSQVSRLLSGKFERHSKGVNALCIYLKVTPVIRKNEIELSDYPELALCLDEVLDGSRKKERAVIRLLKSAQTLA